MMMGAVNCRTRSVSVWASRLRFQDLQKFGFAVGLCRGWTGLDAQVPEQGDHVGPEVLVVLVDGGQPGRDVVVPADLDAGQDRGDDVVPEGEQRRYGPGGRAGQ